MSCDRDLRLKSGRFLAYPYWEGENWAGFGRIPIGKGKIGRVFDVFRCGNMKPGGFCTYPCRGVLHTPRNAPRQRFGCKTGRVLGVSLLGWMKSGAFLVYPCAEM